MLERVTMCLMISSRRRATCRSSSPCDIASNCCIIMAQLLVLYFKVVVSIGPPVLIQNLYTFQKKLAGHTCLAYVASQKCTVHCWTWTAERVSFCFSYSVHTLMFRVPQTYARILHFQLPGTCWGQVTIIKIAPSCCLPHPIWLWHGFQWIYQFLAPSAS